MPPPIRGTWRHSMILGRAKSGPKILESKARLNGHEKTHNNQVYALSCDCCGLCNRHWWHDTFRKRRIVCHELLLGGWQDRLPLQKSLHTHCKGSPSHPIVRWWLIRFSQIMMLCLSPCKERVSVINGKNTKYKKTKSALIKVGGWTIIRSLWLHSFLHFWPLFGYFAVFTSTTYYLNLLVTCTYRQLHLKSHSLWGLQQNLIAGATFKLNDLPSYILNLIAPEPKGKF